MAVLHNAPQVSGDALAYIAVRKFNFGKAYTAFVGNLLYTESHKNDPLCCFVGKLQKLRNFDTQTADIRRTF